MKLDSDLISDFISGLPEDRREPAKKLYHTISQNLPSGFEESFSSGMLHWQVPLSMYPDGYHCTPGSPLPFLSVASQKNFIALYHMGIYADENLLNWFLAEFPGHSKRKPDMGKSCIRFKKPEEIPFLLLAELVQKMTPQKWISLYESQLKK